MTYASTWGLQPGAQSYKNFLDAAVANYPNAKNAGPGGDTGFDRNSTDGRGADAERWNPQAIKGYIETVGASGSHGGYGAKSLIIGGMLLLKSRHGLIWSNSKSNTNLWRTC